MKSIIPLIFFVCIILIIYIIRIILIKTLLFSLFLLQFIISIILYYLYYSFRHELFQLFYCYNMYNWHNRYNIFLCWPLTTSPKRHLVSDTEAVTQNAFVNITDSYCCKNIANPRRCVHFHFFQGPLQTVHSTVFAPPQEEHRCASEPHTRSKAYLTDAQPEDPSGSGIGHV